jgi:predicted nucleic-acid-binding protein
VIAVDTNIIVRLLVGDDPAQGKQAYDLFSREPEIFIAKTVILETAWVLQSIYGFPRVDVAVAVRRVAGLPNAVVENAKQLARALDLVGLGLDFADALHLAAGPEAEPFYTFDGALIRRATAQGLVVAAPELK